MIKRIISVLLAVCMIFGFSTLAFAESSYPKTIPEYVRISDGIGELITTVFGFLTPKFNYPDCSKMYEIPELDKNFVPQGYCYIESENMFAITYYSAGDENTIVSLIDSQGARVKTVSLLYEDGSNCKAHAGGVADIGDSLIISTGKSVRRLKLSDVLGAEDYSYIKFCGQLKTDMQASYICSYENKLFVGQFYSFTLKGTYDTPEKQRIYTPDGKRNYAMCEEYDLSDMDKVFSAGEAVPEMMISMPNNVQGIAFDGETFVTSTSATVMNASKIRYYKLKSTDDVFDIRGNDVPLCYITENMAEKTVKVPPMSEGIDFCNGTVTGIFESGAKKFPIVSVRTPYICSFE